MKNELTEEQVAQLFEFTRKHYVEYYDVQVELVDHLATSIESEIEKNPSLDFDAALSNVFSGFGIFGFDGIQKQKTNAVLKQQTKLWQKTFLCLFKWPNAIFGLMIYLVIYQIFKSLPHDFVSQTLSVLITITTLIFIVIDTIKIKKIFKKKLILVNQRFFYFIFCYIPVYINQLFGFWLYKQDNWLLSIIFTTLILSIHAHALTSKKILQIAKQQYPEAFKTAKV